jgi:peptidylprolyl isomerase
VNNRVGSRQQIHRGAQRQLFTSDRPMSKTEKRAAAKAAAARLARRRRMRRVATNVGAAVVVIGLLVGLYLWARGDGGGGTDTASGAGSPSAAASATNTAFPPLPEGADPALGTKPAVAAGTGELTKLNVATLIEGKGVATQNGQEITVNYVGVSYKDGEEFDSSWKRSQPFSFKLGDGKVIKGWDQGLVGVKVGSRVQLDIPAELAYGDDASGGSPTGPLRFVIDVLQVSP